MDTVLTSTPLIDNNAPRVISQNNIHILSSTDNPHDKNTIKDLSLVIKNNNNLSNWNTENVPAKTNPIKQSPPNLNDDNDFDSDNASVLVIILQCETKPCDVNISNLKWVFSDPYFTVQVCSVDPPSTYPQIKSLTPLQYQENYFIRKALNYAAEGPYLQNLDGVMQPQHWWSKLPTIIVKDSSVSNLTAPGKLDYSTNIEDIIVGGMKRRIKVALDKANQADLFFLCKWNDACDKYTDIETTTNNINHGSSLKWSTRPTATQAIMYVPTARDAIRAELVSSTIPLSDMLNSNIAKGNLLATVFVPNLIDFDIELATSDSDYAKLNECAPVQSSSTSSTTTNTAVFIWFIVIIILILVVAWLLIQVNPQYISAPQ